MPAYINIKMIVTFKGSIQLTALPSKYNGSFKGEISMETVLALIAGLGLFLYGMKLMSEGLEKAAGAKLRNILEMCTRNRFIGMLVGILFTAVVQSSSATTVLVVSFVNAGLLNLMQAAGVILGANIGTTVTAQLMTINLSAAAPIFILIGVIMVMFFKKPLIKRIGEVILGFGILFFGMSYMSDGMAALKESPEVVRLLASLSNPFFAVLTGFLITAVIQSSSATVGIVLVMASQGLISLEMCFYIILGCNMGSCVSALLASIGSKKAAKRAAWIHFIVNIIGTVVIFVFLWFFMDQTKAFIERLSGGAGDTAETVKRSVANAHLLFKLVEVAVCFPLTKWIVRLAEIVIPGEEKKSASIELEYIGERSVFSTTGAVPNAINEIVRMGQIAFGNLKHALQCFQETNVDGLNQVYETEKAINHLNKEITRYLVKVNQLSLPVADRKLLGSLFHVVNDIERIGDHAENVADFTKQSKDDNLNFSEAARGEISQMATTVETLLDYSIEMFEKKTKEHLNEILTMEDQIDEMERRFQHNHVVRLTKNICDPETGMIYSDLLSNLERVADHGTNIAFAILEENPEGEE